MVPKMAAFRGRLVLIWALALLPLGLSLQADSPRLIAVVKSRNLAPYNQAVEGLRRSLASRRGAVHIREFDFPTAASGEEALLESLQRAQPDLIVTVGTQATLAVTRRVHDIPVVFSLVLITGDSEYLLQHRPPNVTGAAMDIPIRLQFERMKDVIPDLKRVGVIFNPDLSRGSVDQAREAAGAAGLALVEIPVSDEAQVLREVQSLKGKVEALWSVADSTVFTPRSVDSILLLTLRDGIPFVGLSPSFVKAGALLSFSCDYADVGAQSAEQALEILAGKSAAELPVAFPRKVSLYLNLNTARAINLEISQKIQSESQVEFQR